MKKLFLLILVITIPLGAVAQLFTHFSRGGVAVTSAYVYPGVVSLVNMFAAGNSFGTSANWTATNVGDTTFSTLVAAPDNSTSSAKLQASTTNGYHSIGQCVYRSSNPTTYRYVITAKKGELTRINLGILDTTEFSTSTNGTKVTFDLNSGTIGVVASSYGSGFSVVSSSITDVGSGFYQVILDTLTSASTVCGVVGLDNGSGNATASPSFSGSGSNGVYIWKANLLPTAAWMLVNNTLSEPMSNSANVDLNNTKAPGYTWYVNSKWSAYTYGTYGLPTDYTFSAGTGVVISQDKSTFGMSLMTAAPNGSSYIGKVFTPPFYAEATIAFDSTKALTADSAFPAFWAIAMEALVAPPMTVNELEVDFFEAYPVANGCIGPPCSTSPGPISTWHNWLTNETNTNSASYPSTVIWNNPNRYGTLWITQAANGGYGLLINFLNGVYLSNSETSYSSTTSASPGAYPTNPVGVFSGSDNNHYPIILGGSCCATPLWPTTYSNIQVYQKVSPTP